MSATSSQAGLALVFTVGARRFAVDAADVAVVARRPILARAPHAPAAIAGVGALLGRATPVVELARYVGEGERSGDRVLVLRGDEPVAIAFDRIEGLREGDRITAERLDWRDMLATLTRPRSGGDRVGMETRDRARADPKENLQSLVEFSLAEQSFAFSAAEVRAVVPASVELATMPDADPIVRGLMAYDDGVLPVVEMADLLGVSSAASRQGALVVVSVGGAQIGLPVERVRGVLRLPRSAIFATSAVLNRGKGEARMTAIARTKFGLTAILSTERLFDQATTRRLIELGSTASPIARTSAPDPTESFAVFRLGEERYGIACAAVDAVAKPPGELSRPPNGPRFLAGVASHRGAIVPLVDQRLRFGSAPSGRAGAVIYLREGGSVTGLLVDAVDQVVRVPCRLIEQAPRLAGDAGELFTKAHIARLDGKPLLIVDAAALLAHARRDLAAWAASRPRRGGL